MENTKITIKLDFDSLKKYKWSSPHAEDLPITSMIKFYQASGIYDKIKEMTGDSKSWACLDILACSYYTLQHIKNFIEQNWKHYNITIDSDEHIIWKKRNKMWHDYEQTLSSKIANSLKDDFISYCPSLDENLEDDVIVLEIPTDNS